MPKKIEAKSVINAGLAKTIMVSVYLPPEILKKVVQRATEDRRSLSQMVTLLVESGLGA